MTHNINIAIDATIIDGSVGGVQNVLESLGLGFKNYTPVGISIYWFVLHNTQWWRDCIPKDHKIIKIGRLSSMIGRLLLKYYPTLARKLYITFYNNKVHEHNREIIKYIKKYDIQLLHTTFQNGFTSEIIPYIYHPHDLQHIHLPEYFKTTEIERRENIWKEKAKSAIVNVVETELVANDLISLWNIDKNNINIIITPPPKLEKMKSKQVPQPFAIYPAAFWEHKNHLKLIKAIEIIETLNVDCDLYLIGNLDQKSKEIRKYIKQKKLGKRIFMTGYITREELAEYLYSCDFVIIPSLYESLSLPGFEALYAGKKIICSNIPQFKYQFGHNARYFNPNDENEIAEKIIRTLGDKQKCNQGFRNSNISNMNSTEFARAFCAIYRQILNQSIPENENKALLKLRKIEFN
jgi:glycosyltransferase involved in cell wall biosynthesis